MNRGTIGKTSKESQSVDEKNALKRLKGSNSNQKVPETSSKQSEISRPKTVGVAKKTGSTVPVLPKSSNKSKLRSPSKVKPLPTNSQPRVIPYPSQKSEKRHPLEHNKQTSTMKVQQESTEIIPQPKKKDLKSKSKADDTTPEIVEIPSASTDTNGKANDSSQFPKDNGKGADNGMSSQPEMNEPKEIVVSETESTNSEVIDLVEISDDSFVLEFSQKPETIPDEQINTSSDQKPPEPSKNDANPADVLVESTTSESSPLSEVNPQVNSQSNEDQVKPDEDPSFISYNANIMLKDVQIKLNDCLRENSKLMDVTDPNASMSDSFKDLSFGRTLRGISGRNSIGRMRHVTLRDRQLTPNDSLFVNTSSASFYQDDAHRYTSGLLDSPSRNGTPLERKRKLGSEVNDSAKKPKQEESSIFNTSLEYIKNLRRPVQVSTPKPKGFKFDIGEKTEGNNENITAETDQTVEQKKWCVVM